MRFCNRSFLLRLLACQRDEVPTGQAAVEYVLVAAGLALVWLAIERQPQGFAQAILSVLSKYKFLISIPW